MPRAMTSTPEPALKPKITVTGCLGQAAESAALAVCGKSAVVANAVRAEADSQEEIREQRSEGRMVKEKLQ